MPFEIVCAGKAPFGTHEALSVFAKHGMIRGGLGSDEMGETRFGTRARGLIFSPGHRRGHLLLQGIVAQNQGMHRGFRGSHWLQMGQHQTAGAGPCSDHASVPWLYLHYLAGNHCDQPLSRRVGHLQHEFQ